MRISRPLCVFVACSLLVSACGGDDDDDGGDTSASDQEIADQVLATFTEEVETLGFTPEDDDGDDDDLEFAGEECEKFATVFDGDEMPGKTAEAESPSYEHGDIENGELAELVTGLVGVLESEEDWDVFFEVMNDDRLPECMADALEADFAEQQTSDDGPVPELNDLTIVTLEPNSIGDESAGLSIRAEFGVVDLFTFPFDLTIEAARTGRSGAMVMTAAIGDGDAIADRRELLQLMVDELEDANL